ncbi:MAG TPA: glycoside hydrolase family 2 TIM barrel-domain containing protein [Terriglobia bacterium]|nr:glycoside hydrolase family 2 TIM barrel-domain containing protein [Terriglobia bacterium]
MNRRKFLSVAGGSAVTLGAFKLGFSQQKEDGLSTTADLSGEWDFRFDPDDSGEKQGWYRDRQAAGWSRIRVPLSFNAAFPDHANYQGKAWHRTVFRLPAPDSGGRTLLRFLGVALRSKVWLNGQPVGEHLFPFTNFTLDVTEAALPHDLNYLVVMADNKVLERAIPDTKWTGWWNCGGINREIYLERKPPAYLEDPIITTRMEGGEHWKLSVRVPVRNTAEKLSGRLKISVQDSARRILWRSEAAMPLDQGTAWHEFHKTLKNVAPWSPEHPSLYSLQVELIPDQGARDQKTASFGFRQIETRGTEFYLNGEPLKMRGINRHELYPGNGMTVPAFETRQDFEDIKKLGCNFVRLTHYQQHPRVYDLCDELGLLLWSEIPAWHTSPATLSDPEVWKTYGAPQLQEMIEQNRNHPSVIIWSVGNEFHSNMPAVAGYVREATRFVRRLDPTRLVTFASDQRMKDISFDYVDFIALNEYYGWYYGNFDEVGPMLDQVHAKWPGKPILISEFGAGSVLGRRNPQANDKSRDYSEDFQVLLLTSHLRQMLDPKRRSFMVGETIWVYNDFACPVRGFHPKPPPGYEHINVKGIVTRQRVKKRAFSVVQKIYSDAAKD